MEKTRRRILILYHFRNEYPMRQTFYEHLYAFQKYSEEDVYYLNASYGVPRYLSWLSFDLVILHSLSIAHHRWRGVDADNSIFVKRRIDCLSKIIAALPQDECVHTRQIEDLFLKLKVSKVFSVANPSEWKKIYPRIDQAKIRQVLTGYLDEDMLRTLPIENVKDIDIGYRAWSGAYWAGRHAVLKGRIGDIFKKRCASTLLKTEISTDDGAVFRGISWYGFLARCKYVIGVEGGSSILDEDGSIKRAVEDFLQKKPKAAFEEAEKNCFPGKDGSLNLKALSPRHLEACATRTCQILIEGGYNGILQPWKHYIPLKEDFSNLEDVLCCVQEDRLREEIVSRAYRDIVQSKKYTYRHFVEDVLGVSLESAPEPLCVQKCIYYRLLKIREFLVWKFLPIEAFFYQFAKKFFYFVFPSNLTSKLKKLRNRYFS